MGKDLGRKLRVLAVEDDDDLRAFYQTVLEEDGYEVRVAVNGLEGLKQLELGWVPDLILLDLMLPVMDGYQFMHRLRGDPKSASIPVLVLSAAVPPGREMIAGAQAVLRKPFDFDRLLRTIELYSHRARLH